MAVTHGVAGEWARVRGTVRCLTPFFIGLFIAGFSIGVMIFAGCAVGLMLLILSLCFAVWGLIRGQRRMESYFKGARGEERVAVILRSLPDTYHIFNDYVAMGDHIDHVVVGPAGVFAVETKFWRGRVSVEDGHILVDGRLPSRPPLDQVIREAKCVKNHLAAAGWIGDVTPLLVFASNTFEAKIAEERNVVIMNANHLTESFTTKHVMIPAAELERLVCLMENNQ